MAAVTAADMGVATILAEISARRRSSIISNRLRPVERPVRIITPVEISARCRSNISNSDSRLRPVELPVEPPVGHIEAVGVARRRRVIRRQCRITSVRSSVCQVTRASVVLPWCNFSGGDGVTELE